MKKFCDVMSEEEVFKLSCCEYARGEGRHVG